MTATTSRGKWLDHDHVLAELVRDAQRGGPGALERLLARLRPSLIAIFAPRLDRDTAEDLAQLALIRTARSLRVIDPPRARPYLVTLVGNLLRSERQRRASDARLRTALAATIDQTERNASDERCRDLIDDLDAGLVTLSPKLRDTFLASVAGSPPSVLAAREGVSAAVIRARIRRARARLKAALAIDVERGDVARGRRPRSRAQAQCHTSPNSEVLRDARSRTAQGNPSSPAPRVSEERVTYSPHLKTARWRRAVETRAQYGEQYPEMIGRYLGPRILSAFADDDVTEIYANPQDGAVRFDTRSRGRVASGDQMDAHRIEMFLNAVATRLGLTLGTDHPSVEAELPAVPFRGSRLQGFLPPVTPAPAFSIRKPPSVVYSLDDYLAAGVVSEAQRAEFRRAVTEHENILIAGGTNTGKTTLANALLKEITELFPTERIVILEDTVELQCAAPDHLALRTTPTVPLAQLVKSALRTSPTRIVVGEVRGSEALELLDAWATGHPGGVATVHASSAEGALRRLDRLAQRANVPPQCHLVAEAIHLIAVLEGSHAQRHVTDLVQVEGIDRDGAFILDRRVTTRPSLTGVGT